VRLIPHALVYPSVILTYILRSGSLPEWSNCLICSSITTEEQVINFLLRWRAERRNPSPDVCPIFAILQVKLSQLRLINSLANSGFQVNRLSAEIQCNANVLLHEIESGGKRVASRFVCRRHESQMNLIHSFLGPYVSHSRVVLILSSVASEPSTLTSRYSDREIGRSYLDSYIHRATTLAHVVEFVVPFS